MYNAAISIFRQAAASRQFSSQKCRKIKSKGTRMRATATKHRDRKEFEK